MGVRLGFRRCVKMLSSNRWPSSLASLRQRAHLSLHRCSSSCVHSLSRSNDPPPSPPSCCVCAPAALAAVAVVFLVCVCVCVFCVSATSVTIVSGAIAERVKILSYVTYAVILSSFIYPLVSESEGKRGRERERREKQADVCVCAFFLSGRLCRRDDADASVCSQW